MTISCAIFHTQETSKVTEKKSMNVYKIANVNLEVYSALMHLERALSQDKPSDNWYFGQVLALPWRISLKATICS